MGYDIVDTQVHIGPGRIEETLAAMDALGIRSVVVDEYWLKDMFAYQPNHSLDNHETRPVCPTAELAAQLYPNRFAWVLRVNRNDPEYEAIIRMVAQSPSGLAVRIIPGMNPADREAFGKGAHDHILDAAERNKVPVCVYLPDAPKLIGRCAEKFPHLTVIVDHCGLYNNAMRAAFTGGASFTADQQMEMFDRVLCLSQYPNVVLKWAHYSAMFETPALPGTGLCPVLRKAIGKFGADRIIWASDFSVNQTGENWGELLYSIKCNSDLTETEKKKILGENARKWLRWEV